MDDPIANLRADLPDMIAGQQQALDGYLEIALGLEAIALVLPQGSQEARAARRARNQARQASRVARRLRDELERLQGTGF
jgi:hypothetical protein